MYTFMYTNYVHSSESLISVPDNDEAAGNAKLTTKLKQLCLQPPWKAQQLKNKKTKAQNITKQNKTIGPIGFIVTTKKVCQSDHCCS